MTDGGTTAFLQQAYRNNWQQYLASLRLSAAKPGAGGGWDVCVLTASDARQAEVYRRQLDLRQEAGLLPSRTRFEVIADPDGQRIGSGGATLRALSMPGSDLTNQKVLIIHSGGDSRRLPHCSATGKLFSRVPHTLPDGRASTLFDEFLINLSGVAAGTSPGVLVASGDVLLIFDHLQLDLNRPGVTGVAIAAPAETGTHHGVYVLGDGRRGWGSSDGTHVPRLRAFLHKPSLERLRQWQAIADDGTVAVDTGLVWLDAPMVEACIALAHDPAAGVFCGQCAEGTNLQTGLNLYGDLLMPLVPSTEYEAYLADTSDVPPAHDEPAIHILQAARNAIWERLRGTPFSVERLQPAVFAHFGTSREYWELVAASPEWAHTWGWMRQTASWSIRMAHLSSQRSNSMSSNEPSAEADDPVSHPVLINALLEGPALAEGEPALIVDSHLRGRLELHGAALLSGVQSARALCLPAGVAAHQLPVNGRHVTRVYGLYDDPKLACGDPAATFMNRPWAEWLARIGLDALDGLGHETIWPGLAADERTLWNARLYPLVEDREESLALSLALQDPAGAAEGWRQRWLAAERLSLAESFRRADGVPIIAELARLEDAVAARRFSAAVEAERPAAEIKPLLGGIETIVDRRTRLVDARLQSSDPILQMRGYEALAEATGDERWEDRSFQVLAAMIEQSVLGSRAQPDARVVRVSAAARIDFGGGWTDTPPYSIERGGTVLNAAITLNGGYPIAVEAERLDAPRLILESADIDARLEPTLARDVLNYANPADPFALLKAAVVMRGLAPLDGEPDAALADLLGKRGGLRLRTQTSIPRGSGLGTSSILAGAVLAALSRWLGEGLTQAQLFDDVLCLEQMLTTGGGWQDQVGGLTGGIKLVVSAPGLPQRVQVEPVRLSPATEAALRERLLLVYTGQQRLAKNLLRAVMGRWMARDPEMVWIQGEIARLAVAMRDALEAGDPDGFGALLSEHWALNKRMDPGCSNPFIDGLFEAMSPYVCGGKLAGAGGGGFAIVVARDGAAVDALGAALARTYPGAPVGIWPCVVPEAGMVDGGGAR